MFEEEGFDVGDCVGGTDGPTGPGVVDALDVVLDAVLVVVLVVVGNVVGGAVGGQVLSSQKQIKGRPAHCKQP